MEKYSLDYTLVAEAESLLYRAWRLLENDCLDAAKNRVNRARELLLTYLAQDNMVVDDDCCYGWIKATDIDH